MTTHMVKNIKTGQEVPCAVCGKLKYVKKAFLIKFKNHYCSRKCCHIGLKKEGIKLICQFCKKEFVKKYKFRNMKFCSKSCANSGDNNCMKNPDVANRVSENNGMKKSENIKKAIETRKQNAASNPEYYANNSMKNPEALRKMINVQRERRMLNPNYGISARAGRCAFYKHLMPDGITCSLQGTWEVALARRLDDFGIKYIAHKHSISYHDNAGIQRVYHPDFFIPILNVFIEVKGWFNKSQQDKMTSIINCNPDKKFYIATKEILEKWSVKLTEIRNELLNKGIK